MTVVADSLLDVGRLLAGCLAPLTGTQARVRVSVNAAPNLQLLPGAFLIPDIGGLRDDLLFRVAPNPSIRTGKWPSSGMVDLVSNIGGARHNVVTPGTVLRFDPPPSGFDPTVTVLEVLQAGVDPVVTDSRQPFLLGATMAESVPAMNEVELWRSYFGGRFPAALVLWAGSDPAAGLATSTLERGSTRVGEGRSLYAESWVVFLVSAREDSGVARQGEGLRLLEAARSLLSDRQVLDGIAFSVPSGVQIRRSLVPQFRVRELQQAFQIFEIDLNTTRLIERSDSRTYSDLLKYKTNVDKNNDEGDLRTERRVVDGMIVENEQE